MKSVFCFIVAAVLLISLSCAAYAADTVTYELTELNMKVDIPADLLTLTRDIDENDPDLKTLGMDKKAADDLLVSSDIYLYAIQPDTPQLIMISMYEDSSSKDIFDFSLYPDFELEAQATREINLTDFEDCNFKTNTIYAHSRAKYVVFDFDGVIEGYHGYGTVYFTIINGQSIGIWIYSYTGELTEHQRELIKQIVDSISFTKILTKPNDSFKFPSAVTAVITVAVVSIIFGIINSRKRKHQKVIFPSQEASAPGVKIRCVTCGLNYDRSLGACPVCGTTNDDNTNDVGRF